MGLNAILIPVTPFEQNCTLLFDEQSRKGAVVDPGGDLDRITAAAAEEGITIEKILVTHGHVDHAAGVADLAQQLGVPVEGPQEEDRFWIDALPEQSERFGFSHARSFTPDRWLNEGDRVQVGDIELQVRHCPGHTPGHVIFYEPQARIAVVGDVLFQGSIGRTDFPRGDLPTLLRSIREKLFPLGDDVTFIPGHGPTSTFGEERRGNSFVGDDSDTVKQHLN